VEILDRHLDVLVQIAIRSIDRSTLLLNPLNLTRAQRDIAEAIHDILGLVANPQPMRADVRLLCLIYLAKRAVTNVSAETAEPDLERVKSVGAITWPKE
jgi:uncharacterized protein with PhoU and TrkA domain